MDKSADLSDRYDTGWISPGFTRISQKEVEDMNDVNYELIGTRIREKREEVGCSQEQLAWDAELSNTYISLVETGKKGISKFFRV